MIVAVRHGRSRPYLDSPFVFPLHPLDFVVATIFINLTRLLTDSLLTDSPTRSPIRTLTRVSPPPNSSARILMYTYFFPHLPYPHTHTRHDFISFLLYHLITPSYNCIVYHPHPHPHPHQSFLYIRNTEICSHGIFSSLSLSLSFLFVSSRLVSFSSLFRFIFTHAYYLTSFVVSARNVALLGLFVYTVYIVHITLRSYDCRLGLC